MRIDISKLTLQIEESILATVLVCGWNLRAWTFLESVKGRHNIHLLCKNNKTVSFLRVARDVFEHGSIDLAILSFTVPHMFPEADFQSTPGYVSSYMTREQSGQVLSYRPTSRQGDDIVIWSLLANDDSRDSAEGLWRRRVRDDIDLIETGFLMSSAPRLRTKGLSWAPSSPFFKPIGESSSTQISSFRAVESSQSIPGRITERGLWAYWHVFEFDTLNISLPP